MRKKIITSIICAAAAFILFFPFVIARYDDGGTAVYISLTYQVINWHRLDRVYNENTGEYDIVIRESTDFYIFPFNFRDNVNGKSWDEDKGKFVRKPGNSRIITVGNVVTDNNVSPEAQWRPGVQELVYVGTWITNPYKYTLELRDDATYTLSHNYQFADVVEVTEEKGTYYIRDGKIRFTSEGTSKVADIELNLICLDLYFDDLHLHMIKEDSPEAVSYKYMPPPPMPNNTEFCDAVFSFSIDPMYIKISAKDLPGNKGFDLYVTAECTGGSLIYYGYSASDGANVRVIDKNGMMLIENVMAYNFITEKIEVKAGDIITEKHHFMAGVYDNQLFTPGVYSVIVSWCGQETVFEDVITITE